jgi:hypothetical protein
MLERELVHNLSGERRKIETGRRDYKSAHSSSLFAARRICTKTREDEGTRNASKDPLKPFVDRM